jgi:hypothetical protein
VSKPVSKPESQNLRILTETRDGKKRLFGDPKNGVCIPNPASVDMSKYGMV